VFARAERVRTVDTFELADRGAALSRPTAQSLDLWTLLSGGDHLLVDFVGVYPSDSTRSHGK
jgi:hypothetical protein